MDKKPLRIAFFVGSFPLLSETFIMNQITGLINRGHHVDIFASRLSKNMPVHKDFQEYDLQKRTHYLNLPKNYLHRLFKLFYLFFFSGGWKKPVVIARALNYFRHGRPALTLALPLEAITFLSKKPYDILHCQFSFFGPKVLSLKETGALSGKLVVSCRGSDVTRNLKENPGIYDHVFQHADCFLPVCDSFREKLIQEGCSPDKIRVHYSGIDCSKFPFRERSRKKDDCIHLLSVARLTEKKGIAYAIRAIAQIRDAHPNLKYTIIGNGVLANELQNLIRKLGLEKHITLAGPKTREEVITHLEKAHLFLAPSLTSKSGDSEGIPNSSKEAMAMGIPVLATFHSGNPELIEDGVSGFMVPEGDTEALAERLLFLIDNPGIWPETGRAAREAIESKFAIGKLNDELEEIYYSLTKSLDSTKTPVTIDTPLRGKVYS